jgi:cell wall-associated NlpC family hydrolase
MQRVIKEAKTYKGTRHVMGGLSHSGIDCSGLLYVSFQANGITNIPRTAQDFARYGSVILNVNEIKAGDLIFFTNTYRTSKLVTHAGICIGNGEFIHTSSSKGVMISKINDPYYWRKYFLFGTRIIN